ncbi:nuclear transport factor 2 family protein [Pontibacter kalidii]|uniref:nuclear transport factor 2 family protein n=1 Tax=Pontibacter kalidii TaxID=2592049 RepID=UPI0022531987|nr:nuclear transport factor 2 family protein [Pontibacter kalidii]
MDNSNVDLVNQYFTYFNNHDWEKMAEMYTETAAFKDPSLGMGTVTQTREQVVQKYCALNEVFPDLHDKVIQVYPSGEQHVIVEFISSGTAPDSSEFELPICTIFTIENGKIVKDFTYYDNFEE